MINTNAISENWGGLIRLTLGDVGSEFAPTIEEITYIANLITSSLTGELYYTFAINDKSINRLYQNISLGLSDTGTPYIRTIHFFEDGRLYYIIYYFNSSTSTYNKKVFQSQVTFTELQVSENTLQN